MRILTIASSYPRTPDDHAGHFVRAGLLALRGRGHEVTVVHPHPHPGGDVVFEDDPGIRRHAVGALEGRSRLAYQGGMPERLGNNAFAALEAPFLVRALLRRARKLVSTHDVVLSHWLVPGGWIATQLGLPHVCVLHSGGVHLLAGLPLGRRLARGIARRTDFFVAVSSALRTRFLDLIGEDFASRVEVRANPLEDAAFTARRRDGKPYALVLGRLVPVKGVDVLLDALEPDDGFEVVVAGDGAMAETLEQRARERGLRAHFVGHVTGAAKRDLIAAAKVVVVPSRVLPSGRTEGAPTVIGEAHAAGVPVIASAVGGIPEQVVAGETGWLVPADEAAALRRALREAMAGDGGALEANCRAAAEGSRPAGFATYMEACLDAAGSAVR